MTSSCWIGLANNSEAIWSVIVRISGSPSRGIVVPRTPLLYLLTADCDTPRTCATSTSFSSCFWRRVCARSALRAGETVFTATSHGAINYPPDMVMCWENLFKHAVCHILYAVCPGGTSLPNLLNLPNPTFQPAGHTPSKRKCNHENSRVPRRKQWKHHRDTPTL